ncbi:hypothetical protein ACIA5H_05700 [Nocardia sp. NPDC051900]|uniref:hypothetical protein n=1 Tax=Nocardia sp. NPDC051900 TaxID=3364326 RepID=UPI00378DEDA6
MTLTHAPADLTDRGAGVLVHSPYGLDAKTSRPDGFISLIAVVVYWLVSSPAAFIHVPTRQVCHHGGMATPLDHAAEYVRPPVRWAEFTLYFEPLRFDVALVGTLQRQWMEKYPAVRQRLPRQRPENLPSVDPFTDSWPMPGVEQATGSFSPILFYQFDQISLKWAFSATESHGEAYPGYTNLAPELMDRFAELVQVVEETDNTVKVQGAQCYYSNALSDIDSIDWVYGVLSNWEDSRIVDRASLGINYLGLKLRRVSDNPQLSTRRTAWISLDEGEGQPSEVDIWSLSVPRDGFSPDTDDPMAVAQLLLHDAHEFEISNFESSFSAEMKKGWGGA